MGMKQREQQGTASIYAQRGSCGTQGSGHGRQQAFLPQPRNLLWRASVCKWAAVPAAPAAPALARLQPLCSSGATAACRATTTRPLYSLPLHSSQRSGPFRCWRTHGFSLCPVPLARSQTSASVPSLVPVLVLAHASSPPIPRRGPSAAQGLQREALSTAYSKPPPAHALASA
jgi:hypothetical protein